MATAALWVCSGVSLNAAVDLTFGLSQEFSGGQAPNSTTTPWVTALFQDVAGDDHKVQLTLTASHLTGKENISEFSWNFNPSSSVALGNLGITINTPAFDASASIGQNAFKVDGDGYYDFLLSFNTGGKDTFIGGKSFTCVISSSAGDDLDPMNFNFLSFPSGGHGPFYAAAHIQNTTGAGTGGSGWIAPVPEASTYLAGLGALGMLGVSALRARKR